MAIAEGLYLRTGERVYLDLAKRWAKGTAVLFAVGAVSGTVLSFELGLLWPKFMEHAGAIIGMPFSLEGFAFFTEAIFLGLYLYGWERLPGKAHWLAGVIVAVSGIFSGIFVVMANAWMNAPTGFQWKNGIFSDIDPIAAMFNGAALHEALHMTLAAFVATGFLVAGIHAYFLLRDPSNLFHRRACAIPLAVACIATPLQLLSGDLAARKVARLQPAKLAAMEAHYQTGPNAPFVIAGIPDDDKKESRYAIKVPGGLSFLVGHDRDTVVTGLDQFPQNQWPNVRLVHWAFDIMIASGMLMLGVTLWVAWRWWKTRALPDSKRVLRAIVLTAPLGFIAIESGWMVTELGRQPWVIYGFLRTSEAVTPMRGLVVPFTLFTLVYIFLSVVLVFLLRRQFMQTAPGVTTEVSRA
jgi:cytochrome d ubiquinol oxidase subunit I